MSFLITYLFFALGLSAQKSNDVSEKDVYILNSDKPKFSITFPGKYKLSDKKVQKGLKTELYQADKNGNIFMFQFSEHKNPVINAENNMYTEAALKSFADGIGAEIIKKYEFNEKKQKGLESFMKIPDKNLYIFYRIIIHKHIEFQLTVITKSQEKTEDINNFFSSFKL